MRYVEARIDEYQREEAYRIYVTRSLQLIPQSQHLQKTYLDIVTGPKVEEVRSGGQIAMEVMKNAGLKFGE